MFDYLGDVQTMPQRAGLRSLGLFAEDLEKPFVGIVVSGSGMTRGAEHLKALAEYAAEGVRSAGGVCRTFFVSAPDNLISQGHHGANFGLPSRETVCDQLEALIAAYRFNGLVFVPDGVNAAAGMMMAACRTNLPCAVIPGGPKRARSVKGARTGIGDIALRAAGIRAGKTALADLEAAEDALCAVGCGDALCTEETFFAVLEALGFSLPDACCMPAEEAGRLEMARNTGRALMKAAAEGRTPKTLVNKLSFKNALAALLALGFNFNTLLHLRAMAAELDLNVPKELGNDVIHAAAEKIPLLVSFAPYGQTYWEDFWAAGGLRQVFKNLEADQLLSFDSQDLCGDTLTQRLSGFEAGSGEHIRDRENAYLPRAGVAALHGNVCEEGALSDCRLTPPEQYQRSGYAKVYDSEEEAAQGIMSGTVRPGMFVFIRGEGPAGGPGMREMIAPSQALISMKLEDSVTLVTDGRISALIPGGVVCFCAPEAVNGGFVGGVKDGDTVELDILKRRLNAKVSSREIAGRMRKLKVTQKDNTGLLKRYADLVTDVSVGCVLAEERD